MYPQRANIGVLLFYWLTFPHQLPVVSELNLVRFLYFTSTSQSLPELSIDISLPTSKPTMYLLPSSRGLCLALLSLLPGSTQAVVQLKIRDLGLDDLANLTAMPWETVDVPESSCCKLLCQLNTPERT